MKAQPRGKYEPSIQLRRSRGYASYEADIYRANWRVSREGTAILDRVFRDAALETRRLRRRRAITWGTRGDFIFITNMDARLAAQVQRDAEAVLGDPRYLVPFSWR